MTTETTAASSLERRITLHLSSEDIEQATVRQLQQMGRKAKLPGFRPGKIPLKVLEKSFGAQARSEALGDALSKVYAEQIAAHKLRPAGPPKIAPLNKDASDAAAQPLDFEATIEVYPDVPLPDRANLKVERTVCEVSDADLDKTMQTLQKQRVAFNKVDRAAQADDQVLIDFEGKLDGEVFEGGKAEGFEFVVGNGSMLEDFDQAVRGMAAGDTKTFTVQFPENYHATNLAGKAAEFTVTLHEAREPELPVLDDEFAKAFGVAEGGLERLRQDVEKNLRREVATRCKNKTKRSVMDALVEQASFELPTALVQAESERMSEEMRQQMANRGMKVDQAPLPPDLFKNQAAKRVRLGLLVGEIVSKEGLNPTEDGIRAMLAEMAQAYENPEEFIRWAMSNNERRSEAQSVVLEDNVVNWVLQGAKVEDKTVDVESLIKETE
ncbi:MAG: trigger factor [Burkholderiaceae bacterium]